MEYPFTQALGTRALVNCARKEYSLNSSDGGILGQLSGGCGNWFPLGLPSSELSNQNLTSSLLYRKYELSTSTVFCNRRSQHLDGRTDPRSKFSMHLNTTVPGVRRDRRQPAPTPRPPQGTNPARLQQLLPRKPCRRKKKLERKRMRKKMLQKKTKKKKQKETSTK